MLKNKNILLCVTGGIAVYKAAALTSKLTQHGANVRVVMSGSATKFVTPITFQALSRNEVYTDTFQENNPEVVAHIHLADWADAVVVAPATANIIGKLANGIADDMISTIMLAVTSDVFIAPAMNVHMYEHPAVKKNMNTLAGFGYHFLEPGEGYLACGYTGKGRLEEPEAIVDKLDRFYREKQEQLLKKQKVLITAGPTREAIDPVRFLTNHSSGKMGYALAAEAVAMGAEVTLVSGPVHLDPPAGVNLVRVESAQEMFDAVMREMDGQDVIIKTAAVADYRPKVTHRQKIKKQDGDMAIEMERTKDILMEVGKRKKHQVLIGFAAETEQVERYAKAKLEKKNADMIVANNVAEAGSGFGSDTNAVTIYERNGTVTEIPTMTKNEVAVRILQKAASLLKKD
ncbi:bifunctional phosphopantothenoylcysteine decarboxylase/phosphopantothenate--cysteine ligase CoaBC [Bacillus testis]|uniref:bifunctional phosphopantothenoylcysteine decarboxylase/phosphopantothenate--cysteine ligase CoaBC n=1 Tax=Bacillus testis TaxID=1622072 RepID=UPI00067EAB9C|nr:bifunctional phosphopantothenoylcysteine decarboxylase/phosphopantothenate--cysteine ligase CoaBC [Bacillus testis]